MLTSLKPILEYCRVNSNAVASVNIFGFEDSMAAIEAAETLKMPVIIAISKDLIEFMPLESISAAVIPLAEKSETTVCLHLDHCSDKETIHRALNAGFTSVMFDGSQLTLDENILRTGEIVELAKSYNATVEGEIGSVSYTTGRNHVKHELTEPESAVRFYTETGVDIMAISVGNVHRLESQSAVIQFEIIDKISAKTNAALCIHGVSGIGDPDIVKLAKETNVAKLNVATLFRKEWGTRLRDLFNQYPAEYDRIFFMKKLNPFMISKMKTFFSLLH